jgi:hypothetical protein
MTASPWAPSNAGGAVAPHITTPTAPNIPPHAGPGGPPSAAPPPPYVPAPPPPRRAGPRLWPIIAAFTLLTVAAIAITAVITSAIVKTSPTAPRPDAAPAVPAAPRYSAAEQDSAKQNVCQAFDAGERGSAGQGGVVVDGQLNVPIVLRKLNTIVVVQNSLSPATPTDVSDAAKKYLATATALTTAALANAPVDELIQLTKTGNAAMDALVDVCGLPH